MTAKTVARFGLLCAVSLVLGYVESLFPLFAGLPGIKLGLANTVLLFAIYTMRPLYAAWLMLVKVLLSGFLFSGLSGILYSLSGGVLSLCAMLLAQRSRHLSIVGVSVTGALFHNIGQVLAAGLLVSFRVVLPYVPVLLLSAAVTGTLTGIAGNYICRIFSEESDTSKKT